MNTTWGLDLGPKLCYFHIIHKTFIVILYIIHINIIRMITLVTTHNLEVFKFFYNHKYHKTFKEKLIVYVDKDDSSEFRKIVDENTTIFDKKDFRDFFGNRYILELSTFNKVYFIYFLFKKGLLNDSFYFTDDDVLVFNESFSDMVNCDKIFYARDMILIIDRLYTNWKSVNDWLNENYNPETSLALLASNFYFPKHILSELKKHYIEVFDSMIEVLRNDIDYIRNLNESTRSKRTVAFSVFYLDTPFFNVVFQRLPAELFMHKPIKFFAYSHVRKAKELIHSEKTKDCLNLIFTKQKATYPKTQPLYHYNINDKVPIIQECFNFLNELEPSIVNVNDLLSINPREKSKILKNTPIEINIQNDTNTKTNKLF